MEGGGHFFTEPFAASLLGPISIGTNTTRQTRQTRQKAITKNSCYGKICSGTGDEVQKNNITHNY